MKIKLTLLSIVAIASVIVTLLALSDDNINHMSPDDVSGNISIISSYTV